MGLLFGGYITVHLLVNATGLWPKVYQQNVDHIHALEPMLPVIEILFIFLPLLVHAIYGFYIGKAGVKFNTMKYAYGGNVRYTLQRWTAYILLAFIAYHIATLHKWGLAGLNTIIVKVHGPTVMVNGQAQPYSGPFSDYPMFNAKNMAYQSTAAAIKTPYGNNEWWYPLNIAVMAFYLLGIWSAVFHWANGLWTAAIAWGLTTTAAAQRRWGHVCLVFGIIMLIIGTTAWVAFTIKGNPMLDPDKTKTLPENVSEQVHSQDTGGQLTDKHIPAGVNPTFKGSAR
jgi:succinate dehydrogenase / fumarate reductase cytochrome b subunit